MVGRGTVFVDGIQKYVFSYVISLGRRRLHTPFLATLFISAKISVTRPTSDEVYRYLSLPSICSLLSVCQHLEGKFIKAHFFIEIIHLGVPRQSESVLGIRS